MLKKRFKKQRLAATAASVLLLGTPYLAQPASAAVYDETAQGDYAADSANNYNVEQTNVNTLTYSFAAGDQLNILRDYSGQTPLGVYLAEAYGMQLGSINVNGVADVYVINPSNNNFTINVNAYGRPVLAEAIDAYAEVKASGIFIEPADNGDEIQASLGSNTTVNVNATGSKNVITNGFYLRNDVEASGLMISDDSSLTIGDNLQIQVKAEGGELTATGTRAREQVQAYGVAAMTNDNLGTSGGIMIGKNAQINVSATGGKITGAQGYETDSDVRAYGVYNTDRVGENAVINVIAKGSQITGDASSTALTRAIGVYSYDMSDQIDFEGNVTIFTQAESGTVNGKIMDTDLRESDYNEPYTGSYAIWADNGTVNVNQTGIYDVKLTGNIFTQFYMPPAAVNVNLNTPDSYWRPTGPGEQKSSFGVDPMGEAQDNYGGIFAISNGATLDLAWWNNRNGNSYSPSQARTFTVYGKTEIGDGAKFLINSDVDNSVADKIDFKHVQSVTGSQYVNVAYDPAVEDLGVVTSNQRLVAPTEISILQYSPYAGAALDGTTVLGQTTTIDSVMYRYAVTPEVTYDESTGETKLVALLVSGSEAIDPGIDPGGAGSGTDSSGSSGPGTSRISLAETPRTASDAQMVMRGLWTTELNSLMRRLGDLRLKGPYTESGFWTRGFGGKVKGDSAYGRSFSQDYGGFQIGYDREFTRDTGTYYVGIFYNYIQSKPKYYRGDGKAHNNGFGLYGTWLSDSGHYTDIVLRGSRLSNKYNVLDLSENYASADYSTWAYGLSIEYGYRGELNNNWFYEPQAEIALGRINSQSYTTSNGMSVNQGGVNTFTGRLGVLFGRYYGRSNQANAYIKGSILRDFSSNGSIDTSYNGFSQRLETGSGFGTVFELNLGTNISFNKTSDFYLELTKQFGGDIKLDWQINAGIRFNW